MEGEKNSGEILFCPHLDTVYIDGMDFKPQIVGRRIYGPGSCDTKGSLAAMMYAFKKLKKKINKKNKIPTIYFAGVIGEEIGHRGIKEFIKDYKNFDFAIIGEPTDLNIGIAHRGYVRFKIKTSGKSAHGSKPELGINAIYSMEKVINNIRTVLIPKYKNIKHKILGNPTLNIGKIEGGINFNIVPDFCIIEIDRRTIPNEDHKCIIKDFECLIDELKVKENDFFAEIEAPLEYAPFLEVNSEEKIVKTSFNVCRKINKNSKFVGLSYTTDGGFLSELKIPTIVLGPGNVSVCHRLGEYVSLDQVNLASKLYEAITLNYY